MNLLEVKSISKVYGEGDTAVHALKKVSFSVPKGEFVAIVGESGSGKSTLLNMVGALDTPSFGKVYIGNKDIFAMKEKSLTVFRRRNIGFIFQSFNLIPGLTALENVELPLLYRKVPKKQRSEIAMRALESVKLSDRALHRPSELSGGQQQRVAIARAVAADPAIILADEPCGNLDSRSGAEVLEILSGLSKGGKTVVMITHNEDTAKKAQRLIRISDGKLCQ